MAKSKRTTAAAGTSTGPVAALSAKVRKAVAAVSAPFKSFARDYAALNMRREELAPLFMNAARLWMAETKSDFVSFVRMLDPNIGGRDEYRNHRSYQAADYLRRRDSQLRKVAAAGAPTQPGQRGGVTRAADAPAAPGNALARVLASLMEIIPPERQQEIYGALQTQLHWTPRQIERIQTTVEHVDPLVHIRARVERLTLSLPPAGERAAQRAAAA